ncbi:MAG: Toluene efflux pump outer membrane protein TtgI [Chlamydiae bacterium]|nr:Toluene efflux pump outer membrane protein TtgI [Chlamydiota bacterium]
MRIHSAAHIHPLMHKALFLLLVCLAGCTFGPDHETPDMCLPCHFEEGPEKTSCMDLAIWWKQFEDPTLDAFIDEALTCNYDLQIALHKIEEVRGLYRIDRSKLYPQIEGNMVAIRARRSKNLTSDIIESTAAPTEIFATDFSGPLIQNFFQIGFDASWELDFFGKLRKQAQAAYRDFEASQENALNVQISLLSDVARSYIDIRSLQQQIDAKKSQIARQRDLLDLAETRYLAGLTSYLDVTRAKAGLDAQESTLPPLEEDLKVTIHGLAIFLGKPPENFCVGEGYIPIAAGRIPHDLPSDLLCRRPDIRQAERELAAATSRIGVAIAELFPSFSLTGSFGTQANMLDQVFIWPSRFWTIGPTMVWNLFTGGRLIAQIKVANERQRQAILAYEKSIIDALKDVEDRLVGYFKEGQRLESLEEQLSTNSLKRDLSFDQYISGLISLDDVLDAEKELFQTQEDMLQSQGTQMIQLVGLYKALGGGWECLESP